MILQPKPAYQIPAHTAADLAIDVEAGRTQLRREMRVTVNHVPGVRRNDPCPCGRGKKFKKCCMIPSEAS